MPDWRLRLLAVARTPQWWPTYSAYLKSPEWAAVRVPVLERAGGRCEECGEATALQVHHLTYKRVGHETPEDLRAICNACHETRHPHMPRTFEERWAAAANPTWERAT